MKLNNKIANKKNYASEKKLQEAQHKLKNNTLVTMGFPNAKEYLQKHI